MKPEDLELFDYVGNALFGNYDYAYVKLRIWRIKC